MTPLQQAKTNSFSGKALLIFLVKFFPSLASVLIVVIFSRMLDRDSYGDYQNFWIQLNIFSAIACLGFQSFIITYSPAFIISLIKRITREQYVGFVLWTLFISLVFASIQNSLTWGLGLLFCFLFSLSIVTEALLLSFRKFKQLVVINIAYTALFISLHLIFLSKEYSFEWLFVGLFILLATKFLVYYKTLSRYIKLLQPAEGVSISSARSLWLHLSIYDTSQILFRWIDKFIISLFLTEEISAIYFNGSLEIPFLPLLLGAAGSAVLMQLANEKKNAECDIVFLVNHSARILSAIVFPLFLFFFIFRYELFSVVLSEKYLAAVPIFAVSVLAMPLKSYSFTSILQNKHKGRVINIGAVLDLLLACALMYPLYRLLGLPGVALSFVISSYLQAGFYLYCTSKLLGVQIYKLIPLLNWSLKLVVFASVFLLTHFALKQFYADQIVLLWGVVLALLACAASLFVEYKAVTR